LNSLLDGTRRFISLFKRVAKSEVLKVIVTLRLTVGQSVSLSWCQVLAEARDHILVLDWTFTVLLLLDALSDKKTGLSLVSCRIQLHFRSCLKSVSQILQLYSTYIRGIIYNMYKASVSLGLKQQTMPQFE
jgi:hypothetical protein